MDTKNDCMIPECGNLAKITGFRVVVGAKQLRKALNNGAARQVFLADQSGKKARQFYCVKRKKLWKTPVIMRLLFLAFLLQITENLKNLQMN